MRREIRCPNRGHTKFADVVDAEGRMEVACRACRKATEHFMPPLLVIHVFDLATGICVATEEIERTGV